MAQSLKEIGAVGILEPHELQELGAGVQRVFNLMRTGAWYNAVEICAVAGMGGIPASEGLRRMRELRPHFDIERRRIHGSRMFEYRLRDKWARPTQLRLIG